MVCPPVAMARSKRGQLKKLLRNERDKHAVRFPAAMLQMRISQERPGNELLSLMMRLRTARARRQTRIASGELRMGIWDLWCEGSNQEERRTKTLIRRAGCGKRGMQIPHCLPATRHSLFAIPDRCS